MEVLATVDPGGKSEGSGLVTSLPTSSVDAMAISAAATDVELTRAAILRPGSMRDSAKMNTVRPMHPTMQTMAMNPLEGAFMA